MEALLCALFLLSLPLAEASVLRLWLVITRVDIARLSTSWDLFLKVLSSSSVSHPHARVSGPYVYYCQVGLNRCEFVLMTEEQPLEGLGTKRLVWMAGKAKACVSEEEGGGKMR